MPSIPYMLTANAVVMRISAPGPVAADSRK
jgi:hypothetical protein